jgi:hypothetical protein
MTPNTEAGRGWLGHSCDDGVEEQRDHILAIEAEARADVLAEVRAKVERIPGAHVPDPMQPMYDEQDAAAIEEDRRFEQYRDERREARR